LFFIALCAVLITLVYIYVAKTKRKNCKAETIMDHYSLSRILSGLICCCFIIVRLYFTVRYSDKSAPNKKINTPVDQERRLSYVIRRLIILPLLLIVTWLYYALNPSWMLLFILPCPEIILYGITIIGFIGIAFLIWVHLYLGKEWSAALQIKEGHQLIISGPYSKIRHPMYTALFTVYLCFALVSMNLLIILFTVLAITSLAVRVSKEEKLLISEFGDRYRNYMEHTGRYFPKF